MFEDSKSRGGYWPLLALVFLSGGVVSLHADSTWTYTVQLSAAVETSPARIHLSWLPDPYDPASYTIHRKLVHEQNWSYLTTVAGSATTYTDSSVSRGIIYEYQVFKQGQGYTGYGYIAAGAEAPMIEDRGTIVLIVAADTTALSTELRTLESDLAGDGWKVVRHDISPWLSAVQVKELIVQSYYREPSRVKAVFLFGSVPVFISGYLEYDGHGARSMPADAFYGDIGGDWRVNQPPEQRPSFLPSDVELMVGRVDFSNMPGKGVSRPWPSETELLRRYLNKDHAWRHKLVHVPRQALMANRVGDANGMAYAASGYRNFEPLVGHGNVAEANVQDSAPSPERWINKVSTQNWLWTYACGAGTMSSISFMGFRGNYNEAWSADMLEQNPKAVFTMLLGSHFGAWQGEDNLLRSVIAAPTVSLTACLSGLPHWYVHHMGKGETIGFSTRLTMNNSSTYRNHSNPLARAITVNLMGDPTLRLEPVAPPGSPAAISNPQGTTVTWAGSADAVIGYHVYRSDSAVGPFSRLTGTPLTEWKFVDPGITSDSPPATYMIRAVALQVNPSGSYYNPSQGAFVAVNTKVGTVNDFRVSITMTPAGPNVKWQTQAGTTYRVQATPNLQETTWADISGNLAGNGADLSFIDPDWANRPGRLYRILAD